MVLEVIVFVYIVAAVAFFIALASDKYVEKTKGIVFIYILASILWPLTTVYYIID